MSSNERRIAPRKIFSIPIRIRPLASESLSVAAGSTSGKKRDDKQLLRSVCFSCEQPDEQRCLDLEACSRARHAGGRNGESVRTRNLFQDRAESENRAGDGTLFHATARIDGAKSGTGAMQRARGACRTILGRAGMDGSGRVRGTVRTVAAISNLGQLNLRQLSGCATY